MFRRLLLLLLTSAAAPAAQAQSSTPPSATPAAAAPAQYGIAYITFLGGTGCKLPLQDGVTPNPINAMRKAAMTRYLPMKRPS